MNTLYCPTCQQRSISEIRRSNGLLVTADAICDNGHLWQAKWLRPAIAINDQAS